MKKSAPAMPTISAKARIAGVIGWPVGHSLSPRIHNFWLSQFGIDGVYIPLNIAPGDLKEVLRTLPKLGLSGFNITLPYKEDLCRAVDMLDREAARIGAVNTVVIDQSGKLRGSNTDAWGFTENLRQETGGKLKDFTGRAVMIGAGGAARAVATALLDEGFSPLVIVNRTQARAEELAQAVGGNITVLPWENRAAALEGASLLVNTSSLGMTGFPPLDLPLDALPKTALVNDIVYSPLRTSLLERAAARGNTVVDGLGMLLHQARPGFKAWFGAEPEVTDALRAYVLAQYKSPA
jgi:shikimate dehydrogenase